MAVELLTDTSGVGRYEAWARRALLESVDGLMICLGHLEDVLPCEAGRRQAKERDLLPRLRRKLVAAGAPTRGRSEPPDLGRSG